MKYKCFCVPKQEYPHVFKSPKIRFYWFKFFYIVENLEPAMSCDNHPIPLKRFSLVVRNYKLSFGKIIY